MEEVTLTIQIRMTAEQSGLVKNREDEIVRAAKKQFYEILAEEGSVEVVKIISQTK